MALPARVLVGSVTGGAFVVALLEDEKRGRYVLLVNKDAAKAATAKAVVQRACREVAWLDALDGRWRPLPLIKEQAETAIEVPLPPGGGKLLRVE